ncbi:TRAFAC clade GTPase domain-containing protein [Microbacterium suwonense]|uniref:ATP-binding protein n=1 Tax=Microbacterium suwonense TaxID=683047 RepID=A0ABM8FXJ4_9MICO|nr:ATP/GTP-binding protein [Microbacterium suwonense]BDZ40463.1 ATP-binding protein [Microbacterium suwonense]
MKNMVDQHIAVFGESGSGKTVLLSSFYGPTQEKGFAERNRFNVVAESQTQAVSLYQNYVGMRDSRILPEPTQFRSTAYSFLLKMAVRTPGAQKNKPSHDMMRVVWHDYPGEWFEKDVSGEEADRRVEGFRELLGSDVAILLVDAQRLIDNAGQEHAYLKSLFFNYRQGFEALKDSILDDGSPLTRFPRIWMIALSKADLLPDLDVHALKDLVIGKAGADLARLNETISSMVQAPDALSVGDDFLLLSSAKFTPEEIRLEDRIGLDLILPIASVLPYERHLRWVNAKQLPVEVGKRLLSSADALAGVLGGVLGLLARRAPVRIRPVVGLVAGFLSKDKVEQFVEMGRDRLEEVERTAVEKREYLIATLAKFRIDLQAGEADDVLLRSLR